MERTRTGMFANRQYNVDSLESIDSLIKAKITSCLTREMLHEMILEPDRFGEESYFKFLLNMYCDMCELTDISYYPVEWYDCEPITHMQMKNQNIAHIFATPVLVNLFKGIIGSNTCQAVELSNPNVQVRQIQVLPNAATSNTMTDGLPVIPSHVADKLIMLTVIADHGAWHYYNLKRRRNDRDYRLNAHYLNRHVSLASLITSTPNSQVQKQVVECMHPCMIIKTSHVDDAGGGRGDRSAYDEDDDENEHDEDERDEDDGDGVCTKLSVLD